MIQFNYRKAIQILNLLARKEGGVMNKMKALKLLWLADRLHARMYGRTITGDCYKAMHNGPVASATRDILEYGITKSIKTEATTYLKPIEEDRYLFGSVGEVNYKVFSKTDIDCLDMVTETFGDQEEFQLSKLSHSFPEWKRWERELLEDSGRAFDIRHEDFFDSKTTGINKLFNQSPEQLQQSLEAFSGQLYKEKFDLAEDKAFNVLIYYAERLNSLYLNKALLLLYIADETAVKQSGVPVTWMTYKAWRFGPIQEALYKQIRYAGDCKKLGLKNSQNDYVFTLTTDSGAHKGIIIKPKKSFDDSQFSDYDIDILDATIEKFGLFTTEQLSDQLRQDGTLWHKVVKEHHLQKQFDQKNNRSDYIIEFTDLLDTDFKKSAYEVAYQSYLMQANLI